MKLASVVIFGAGYVLGARAGRERHEQIAKVAERASRRLEELGTRLEGGAGRGDGHARRQKASR